MRHEPTLKSIFVVREVAICLLSWPVGDAEVSTLAGMEGSPVKAARDAR